MADKSAATYTRKMIGKPRYAKIRVRIFEQESIRDTDGEVFKNVVVEPVDAENKPTAKIMFNGQNVVARNGFARISYQDQNDNVSDVEFEK